MRPSLGSFNRARAYDDQEVEPNPVGCRPRELMSMESTDLGRSHTVQNGDFGWSREFRVTGRSLGSVEPSGSKSIGRVDVAGDLVAAGSKQGC